MNIASVPCRCGQSWTVPARGPAASGTPAPVGERPPAPTSSRSTSTVAHDVAGLGEHRRAGRVDDHAPGPDQVERRVQQPALEGHQRRRGPSGRRRQRDSGRRRSAPSPVHGASTSTRSKAAGPPRRPRAVGDHHPADAGRSRQRPGAPAPRGAAAARARPAGTALGRQRGQQRGLAAGAGAQVEPPLVAALDRRARSAPARPAGEPSSCTPARPSATAANRRGVAAARAPRRTASSGSAPPGSSSRVERPGRATSVTRRGVVVGGQQRVELVGALAQRLGQPLDDPRAGGCARPTRNRSGRWPGSGATRRTHAARSCSATRRSTALTKPAAPWPTRSRDQVDGGADRGVRRGPASTAAGGRRAAARRAPWPRPWPAAGRRRRRAPRRRCPAGGSCRRRARWRRPRRARSSPCSRSTLRQHQVGVGVVDPHGRAARRTPPAGPGRREGGDAAADPRHGTCGPAGQPSTAGRRGRPRPVASGP